MIDLSKVRFCHDPIYAAVISLEKLFKNINPVPNRSTHEQYSKKQGEVIFDVDAADLFVNVAEDGLDPVWKSLTESGGTGDVTQADLDSAISAHAASEDAHHAKVHTHSGVYLPVNGKAVDSDKLDGYHYSSFAWKSHSHSYLPLSGGTLSGMTTFNSGITVNDGGNTVIGTIGGFPFFPLGIALGPSSSAAEYIVGDDGKLHFNASSGFDFNAYINMNGNKITGLVNPTAASDAVTKTYVDDYYLRRIGGTSYPMAGYLFTGGYGIAFESTTPMNTWITTGVESTKTYLQLMGKDEVLISTGGAAPTGKLRAKISSDGLTLLNSDNTHAATISVNSNGDLVFHVAAGKGIIFEEG